MKPPDVHTDPLKIKVRYEYWGWLSVSLYCCTAKRQAVDAPDVGENSYFGSKLMFQQPESAPGGAIDGTCETIFQLEVATQQDSGRHT